jgi:hypothetical protein
VFTYLFLYAVIDSLLHELNHQFSEHVRELLMLRSAIDSKEMHESFRIDDICLLVNNFYLQEFTDSKRQVFETELHHYQHNVVRHPNFENLSSVSELYQWLVRT